MVHVEYLYEVAGVYQAIDMAYEKVCNLLIAPTARKFPPAMSHHTPFLPGLSPLKGRSLHLRFDAGAMSSNGGALILREIERKLGIADGMASCVVERRRAERTQHDSAAMIRAHMMAIACGCEDCNDLDVLRHNYRHPRYR